MNQFKAVIFDFDGLLVDNEPMWEKTFVPFFARHGIAYNHAVRLEVRGMGLYDAVSLFKRKLGMEGHTASLVSEWRNILYSVADKEGGFPLMRGAINLLRSLQGRYKIALATGGHSREKIGEILEKLGVDNYFEVIISSDEVTKGKPHPDVYLLTAQKLRVLPRECLVLEDAPNGVVAAKRAGMIVYCINKDAAIRKKLKEAGADKVFANLEEVIL